MTTQNTAAPTFTDTLGDLTSGQRYAGLLAMIGSVVNYDLPGVRKDVERWLGWILTSGTQ